MAVIHSPNIVRSGLVMHVDAANVKSLAGEPTINLVPNPDFSAGTTNWTMYFGGGSTNVNSIATVADVPRTYGTSRNVLQCNTSTTLSGGGNYGGIFQSGYSLTAGLSYTISYYARSLNGSLTVRFSNQTGSGDESNLSHSSSLTSAWTKFTQTVTLDLAKSIIYFYNATLSGGIFQIADVQIEQKSYDTTFVNGTRGTTVATGGGWADLTTNGNNGTLANGPTYSSANGGSIVFDGIDDRIINIQSSSIQLIDSMTISCWFKPNNFGSRRQGLVGRTGLNEYTITLESNGNVSFYFASANQAGGYFNLASNKAFVQTNGVFQNLAIVRNYTTNFVYFYKNGLLTDTSGSMSGADKPLATVGPMTIGEGNGGYFNGSVANLTLYNRALTAAEILQNFEAQRTRFNV